MTCAGEQQHYQNMVRRRQHPAQFNMTELIAKLLPSVWMHHIGIFQNDRGWMVMSPEGEYLRHSAGPLQGFFWDVYGDDFLSPELALIAISQSQPPRSLAEWVIPTHGK